MPDMTRLRAVLEVHGADPARWPAEERPGLETLIAGSEQAAAALAEAAALDRLLAAAPATGERSTGAIADAVMARLGVRVGASGGRTRDSARPDGAPSVSRTWRAPARAGWQVGAMLAASLILGFVLGSGGYGGQLLDGLVATLAGDVPEVTFEDVALGEAEFDGELL
jgi:hypothetical protein